jgi:hypothetical protein
VYKRFQYYLLKPDGRSGQVVNGVVSYSGSPKPLPQNPDGWQNITLAWERSLEKYGLVPNFSLPLGFVRNGAKIIRDALYKQSIEEEILLLIQRLELELTDTTFNWVYKYFFRGELDLSKVDDKQDMISVPIVEGGLMKLLTANWNTNYEFIINDPDVIFVKMDGIRLDESAAYNLLSGVEIGNDSFGASFWLPMTFINKDGQSIGIAWLSQSLEDTSGQSYSDRLQSTNYFAKALDINDGTINISFVGTIRFTCTQQDAANGIRMRFLRSNLDIGNQDDYLVVNSSLTAGQTYEIDINLTIPLQPGERLYFEGQLGTTGTLTQFEFLDGSDIKCSFSNTYKTTNVPCYRRSTLYKRLIKAIAGSEDNAISQLCDDFDDLLITCGDFIRNIPNSTLKTSLADFFADCDSTFMAGMAINNGKVELESREKYFQESDEVDLGEVTDLEIKPIDFFCNTYKFGHPKQASSEVNDINGKYGFNGNNQFTGPITKITKEYNAVSPYKADPYEIELLRINLDGKTTSGDNSDNDVYVIKAKKQDSITATLGFDHSIGAMFIGDASRFSVGQQIRITGTANNDGVYDVIGIGSLIIVQIIFFAQSVVDETDVLGTIEWLKGDVYLLDRPAFDELDLAPDPDNPGEFITNDTIFNIPLLTPKRMLLRHGRWVRSLNAGLDNKKIIFSSGKENKNTELKTVLGTEIIDEDKDELIAGFGDYLFFPFYFIFKTIVPINLPELLEENPNRVFKFTDEYGQEWKGFLMMAGIAPNEYTPQEFRLLAAPSNDIKKLIR